MSSKGTIGKRAKRMIEKIGKLVSTEKAQLDGLEKEMKSIEGLSSSVRFNSNMLYVFFAFFIIIFSFIAYLMYSVLSFDNTLRQTLYLGTDEEQSKLTSTNGHFIPLYIYSTQQEDIHLSTVSGQFIVSLANNNGIKFRVVDENGTVIGTNNLVPTSNSKQNIKVPFSSTNAPTEISLEYNCSRSVSLYRIEIDFKK